MEVHALPYHCFHFGCRAIFREARLTDRPNFNVEKLCRFFTGDCLSPIGKQFELPHQGTKVMPVALIRLLVGVLP